MISRSVIYVSLVTVLCMALLLNACNPKPGQSGLSDTTQTSGVLSATLPAITLHSLTITGAAFIAKLDTAKKQNIIFNYFLADTAVTLHGWALIKGKTGSGTAQKDTGSFDTSPDLKLTPVAKSAIAIGPNTYLSNQVIIGKKANKIWKLIRGKNTIFYFSPMKDATGRIWYEIKIRIIAFDGTSSFALDVFETNPAPPHQAFD